jgi:nucleoside-diphosphate-sugar epimerase
MNATVLVTGYGGFLGQAICRELLAHGYRVRGMARNHYPNMAALGVECIRASATQPDACLQACQGVQAVIHTAALAGVWGRKQDYVAANVLATQHLLNACRSTSVQAFVYTSSPSVTFDGKPQSNVDETAPYPTRWLCDYPRTKAIAEQLILDANGSDLTTCSLRPHLIWGVGDPHLIPRVIERCRSGRLRRVGDGKNLIDTVHVESAALAHRLALERMMDRDQQASGRAYFITDDAPIPSWDWITTLLQSADLEPPHRSLSLKSAYRIGWLLEILYAMMQKRDEPPMTRFVALQLGVDHYFDIRSAKERLGYTALSDRNARVTELGPWLRQRPAVRS